MQRYKRPLGGGEVYCSTFPRGRRGVGSRCSTIPRGHSRTAVPPIFGGTAVRNRKAGIFRTVAQFCSEHKSYSVPNRVFRIFYSNCSEQNFIGFFSEQPFRINTAICSEQSVPNGSCIFFRTGCSQIVLFFSEEKVLRILYDLKR